MSTPAIFKPADILILIVVLTVAYFWSTADNHSNETATQLRIVTSQSDDTISLFIDTLLSCSTNVTVEIHNGSAAITESDCPTGLCVKTGFIQTPGQISVCMPNGVWIEILGEETITDVVSY